MAYVDRVRLTIPNGTAVSAPFDFAGGSILRVGVHSGTVPATTELDFQTSADGVTWFSLYDGATGNALRVANGALAVGRVAALPLTMLNALVRAPLTRVRLATSTTGADMNASGDTVITVVYDALGLYS